MKTADDEKAGGVCLRGVRVKRKGINGSVAVRVKQSLQMNRSQQNSSSGVDSPLLAIIINSAAHCIDSMQLEFKIASAPLWSSR